jgi:hypothetical protein
MKTQTSNSTVPFAPSTEADIRDYAYHLYIQSGCTPNHEVDNWLEAKACLNACVPMSESHARLHLHSQKKKSALPVDSKSFAA